MKARRWFLTGLMFTATCLCLSGCASRSVGDQRMARYHPDGSRRRPSEWAERAAPAVVAPGTAMAAVSNTADIAISTADSGDAEYNGAGEVLRRGAGLLAFLMLLFLALLVDRMTRSRCSGL